MSDADPPRPLAHAPGGSIPPGVLDPSIVTLSPPTRWDPSKVTASDNTALSRSSRAFLESYRKRMERPFGGFWRGGEIARKTMYDELVPNNYIPEGLPPIISDERIEELWIWMGLNQEPGEIERNHGTNEQVQKVTPQFILRNVKRAEFETNPHNPPYHIEIWRDPVTPEKDFPSQMVLTYKRPNFSTIETTTPVLRREQKKRHDQFVKTDWAENWGDWWVEAVRPKFDTRFFPVSTVQVIRGRFANAAEAEAEAEKKKKHRKQNIHFSMANPDGVWSESYKK